MSTFTWLNKQGVASDAGFALQRVGRFEWDYREGESKYSLFGEPIFSGGHGFAFGEWEPSPLPAKRQLIQENIEDAMKFMGLKAEFA